MRDFSIQIYLRLLDALQESDYHFQTFSGFLKHPKERTILLRHDVDDRKEHSLRFARIQHERGMVGTFYFRVVPRSFDRGVIREIAAMGHEIGYHYEDMDLARGNPVRAADLFERHLAQLRDVAPVETICMHGSPLSPYDNRALWETLDYGAYGILGEPYLDLDFRNMLYLTDTGRRWDGHRVSIRDKTENGFGLYFHSTMDIIACLRARRFPDRVMMTFHPQRWTDQYGLWLKEKYAQKAKNLVKYFMAKYR